jgi:hypothetical protein
LSLNAGLEKKGVAGHYLPWQQRIELKNKYKNTTVLLHEFGHHVQAAIPALEEEGFLVSSSFSTFGTPSKLESLEHQFWEYRRGTEQSHWLSAYNFSGVKDKFIDGYMGVRDGIEVWTRGSEYIYWGGAHGQYWASSVRGLKINQDIETYNFLLGILAGL